MKTTKHMAYALLVLLAAACGKEEFDIANTPPQDALVEMSFTATASTATRTALGGNDGQGGYPVLWTAGDAIAVMPMSGSYDASAIEKMRFTTTIEEGETAATATFTGRTVAGDNVYVAFYPHGRLLEYSCDQYDYNIYYNLPTEQPAVAGTFAPNLCPAYAMTEGEGGDLAFEPLCGLVKFRLSGDAVAELASVRFAAGGQILSGNMDYPQSFWPEGVGAVSYVTLTGVFEADADYYMAVRPCSLADGFSFTFTLKDGSAYVREGKIEGGAIDMGRIGNLGLIDLSEAVFAKPAADDITDIAFIQAVEAGADPAIVLERSSAGYVPLTEQNLKAMASVRRLDVSSRGLTDASALRYFTGLTELKCRWNSLTELDVSGMKELTYLSCRENQLTSLVVDGLANLTYLDCRANHLTELAIGDAMELTELYCQNNSLTELDITRLTKLEQLDCSKNGIEVLDVDDKVSLVGLDCSSNRLSGLDVRRLTGLTLLYCFGNRIPELDISQMADLQMIYCGKQTTDGTEPLTLTLTLTAAQRDGVWAMFSEYTEYNQPVVIEVAQP